MSHINIIIIQFSLQKCVSISLVDIFQFKNYRYTQKKKYPVYLVKIYQSLHKIN